AASAAAWGLRARPRRLLVEGAPAHPSGAAFPPVDAPPRGAPSVRPGPGPASLRRPLRDPTHSRRLRRDRRDISTRNRRCTPLHGGSPLAFSGTIMLPWRTQGPRMSDPATARRYLENSRDEVDRAS